MPSYIMEGSSLGAVLDINYTAPGQTQVGPTPTFSRASSGTYFDSNGVLKTARLNSCLYSEDLSNAVWSKGGATVTANAAIAPDGTTTADLLTENSANSNHRVYQNCGSITDPTVSCYVKPNGRTWINLLVYGNAAGYNTYFNLSGAGSVGTTTATSSSIENVGDGWYRISAHKSGIGSGVHIQPQMASGDGTDSYLGDGTSGMYVWGCQVESGASVTTYTKTTSAANAPKRENYAYDGAAWVYKGLLLEEQRQNLATYCNDFSNAAWTKTAVTISTNQTTAPDGTTDADLVYPSSTGSDRYVFKNNTGGAALQSRTNSCFFKAAGKSWIALINSDGATAAWFNLSTGAKGTVIAGSTSEMQSVGDGWYRCSVTRGSTASSNSYNGFFICDGDNSTSVTASSTDGVYAWGMQLEAGAFASSFIPAPAASQVIRSADVFSITGSDFSGIWNATEGTLALEADSSASGTSGIVGANDGTANERLEVYASSTDPKFIVVDGGVTQADIDGGTISARTKYKIAACYKANDFAISVNGGASVTDTGGTLPTVTALSIGRNQAGNYLNGHLQRVKYYPTRLAAGILERLST